MLNLNAFRLIKPVNAQDDWVSGEGCTGNYALTTVERGKEYREAIIKFLKDNGPTTVTAICDALGICRKVANSIVQKMNKAGAIEKAGKVPGTCRKKAFAYRVVA